MADRRVPLLAAGGVVGLLAVVGCVVALGAAAGPGTILTGHGHASHHQAVHHPVAPASIQPTPHHPQATSGSEGGVHLPDWLAQALWVLLLVGVVLLVLAVIRAVRRYVREDKPAEDPLAELDFDPLADPEWIARQLTAGAADQQAVLLEGPPRNAVVACWERFEELLTEAGVPRQPWETSTEFTVRVLAAVDAEPDGVRRFAALYREARFSDHLIGEEHRSVALTELASIHAWLAIVAAGSPEVAQ